MCILSVGCKLDGSFSNSFKSNFNYIIPIEKLIAKVLRNFAQQESNFASTSDETKFACHFHPNLVCLIPNYSENFFKLCAPFLDVLCHYQKKKFAFLFTHIGPPNT